MSATFPAVGQGYLFDQAQLSVGRGPFGTVKADFNRDGLSDLAVANESSNTVSILLGEANGRFGNHVDYPAAASYTLTVGDFNGDKKLDLAVVGRGAASVSILLGNGDGTFQPYTTIADNKAAYIVAGDFNHDGKLDLATATTYPATSVAVLLGNGDGTFDPPVNYSQSITPSGMVLGDFDRDGNLDIVTAGFEGIDDTALITLFRGNGDGTFQPAKYYETIDFGFPASITSADFNHDGNLDLALAESDSTFGAKGFVLILPGDGAGNFSTGGEFNTGTTSANWVTAADLNRDGKLDLVVSASGALQSNSIATMLGNGDGTFQPAANYGAGSFPGPSVVADFNRDGKPDIAIATIECSNGINCQQDTVSVLLGNGRGGFAPLVFVDTGAGNQAIAIADLNGDSKNDVVLVDSTTDNAIVLLNTGAGFSPYSNYDAGFLPTGVATADLNGDGYADLAIADQCGKASCQGQGAVSILLNNGDGTFAPKLQYPAGTAPKSITAGDFNGDGRPDLVVANYSLHARSTATVLLNQGNGTFAAGVPYLVGIDPLAVAVGDFNRDGKLDMAVAVNNDELASSVSILLGNGDGTFQPAASFPSGGYSAASVTAGDLNGDGILDLAVTNSSGVVNFDNLAVLLGNGDGTFQPAHTYAVPPVYPGSVVIDDINGDGRPDVAISANLSEVLVYPGKGNGNLGTPFQYLAPSARGIAAADLDGDGKLDIVATDQSTTDKRMTVYLSSRVQQ